MQKTGYYIFIILLLFIKLSFAQSENERIPFSASLSENRGLMDKKDFKAAEKNIRKQLKEIYSKKINYPLYSDDFIFFDEADNIDYNKLLNKLYKEKKPKGFFIEENNQLFILHFDLGRCYFEMHEYDKALNNYYQALRFHSIIPGKDDAIFYQIAWSFKRLKKNQAYLDNLETAYELNPSQKRYSLELGRALYLSKQPKKAIFHLNEYIQSKGDAIKEENLDIFIKIANLNEKTANYLETARHYKAYLKRKPQDPYINFALGFIAYKHIGDYPLALASFKKTLEIMPKKEIWRISKAYEFIGDMHYSNLKFNEAIQAYLATIKYQDLILKQLQGLENQADSLNEKIYELKRLIQKSRTEKNYTAYLSQSKELASLKYQIIQKNYEYKKLNRGKIFWNTAEIYEKMEKYNDSINYYQKAISVNYKPNYAQKRIKYCKEILVRGFKVPVKY